jgi:hypothetical protein
MKWLCPRKHKKNHKKTLFRIAGLLAEIQTLDLLNINFKEFPKGIKVRNI